MGKDNTALWLIGGAAIAFFLLPQETKDKITNAIPSIGGSGVDLTGLIGDIIPTIGGGGAGGGITPSIESLTSALEGAFKGLTSVSGGTGLGDIGAFLQNLIPSISENVGKNSLTSLEDMLKNLLPKTGIPSTTPSGDTTTKTPNAWQWFTSLNPMVQNIAAVVGGGALAYGGVKAVQVLAPLTKIGATPVAKATGGLIANIVERKTTTLAIKPITQTLPKLLPMAGTKAAGITVGGVVSKFSIVTGIVWAAAELTNLIAHVFGDKPMGWTRNWTITGTVWGTEQARAATKINTYSGVKIAQAVYAGTWSILGSEKTTPLALGYKGGQSAPISVESPSMTDYLLGAPLILQPVPDNYVSPPQVNYVDTAGSEINWFQ